MENKLAWRSRILLLSIICALSPFAMSVVVPAFPLMSDIFQIDASGIQYMVSAFLLGLGIAQPIMGILADRYGRRIILLFGFALFFIASALSLWVTEWHHLILLRCLQGVGVSAGTVTSRAMITDTEKREAAAASYSYLALAMMVGPVAGPLVGALLMVQFGWRGIFGACALMGLLVWLFAFFYLRETLSKVTLSTRRINFKVIGRGYARLLTSPGFIGYTLVFGFSQGMFFCFLPIGPEIFATQFGLRNQTFVVFWLLVIFVYILGTVCNTISLRKMQADSVMHYACIGMLLTGIFCFPLLMLDTQTSWIPLLALVSAMFFTGMATPLALNGAISANPDIAGLGSGLSSAVGMLLGGLFAVLSGLWYDLSMSPMLVLMIISGIGAFLAFQLAKLQPVSLET